jgi:acetyl esterase/lipase
LSPDLLAVNHTMNRRWISRASGPGLGLLVLGVAAFGGLGLAAGPQGSVEPRAPTVRDVAYGPHSRHLLDLWLPARATGKIPVLIYFHGGGFRGGEKSNVPGEMIVACQDAGIALVSASYRLSHQAPYPAPMQDGARVVQFIREHAWEWGIDGERVALAGNSAGAGIALWVAFHEDLRDGSSSDAVDRQSSRVTCAAVVGAQTSYDPEEIKEWIGGRAHEHPALPAFFGVTGGKWDRHACRDASPIEHVSSDDPPVWMDYSEVDGPLPENSLPGVGIHHPNFGRKLRERMEGLGIDCDLQIRAATASQAEGEGSALVEYVRERFDHTSNGSRGDTSSATGD